VNLRQILVAHELDAIRENDVIDWAAEQLALDLYTDLSDVGYLASLDRKQADEVRTTLFRIAEAAAPDFTVRSPHGEAIARDLLAGMELKYLARRIRPYELCRLVTAIEGAYGFPAWLGNLYDACDWIQPETTIDDVPHLASAVGKLRADEEERVWDSLQHWLTSVLLRDVTNAVTHVYFLLYETTGSFVLELTGTQAAYPESGAVTSAFSTAERSFHIDRLFVADEWQHALELSARLARRYMSQGQARHVLASAVAEIGFVDGDLTRIWPEPAA
jgi:hypothetical protein